MMGIDWVIDRIPGVRRINFSLKSNNKKIAVLAEPVFLGLILGILLSAIGGYAWRDCLATGMTMAGVMFLLPRMVKILMEGLAIISNGMQEFLSKRFPGRKINLGMDMAVMLGDSEIISLALIMTPITLLLAVVLPGNTLLPFTDLPALTYFVTAPVVAARRNSFRSLLLSVIMITIMLYIATDLAPYFTTVGQSSGLVDGSMRSVSALSGGGEMIAWVMIKIISLFT
jgi:PTS system galactitol-specific IIC component